MRLLSGGRKPAPRTAKIQPEILVNWDIQISSVCLNNGESATCQRVDLMIKKAITGDTFTKPLFRGLKNVKVIVSSEMKFHRTFFVIETSTEHSNTQNSMMITDPGVT